MPAVLRESVYSHDITDEEEGAHAANALSSSPQELAAYMRSETIKWGKIIKAAGIKLDAQ